MSEFRKADNATSEARVHEVLVLICRGWFTPRIIEYARREWGIEQAQAYNYVRKARRRIEAIYAQQQEHGLQEMLARHADLRDKGYQDKDLRLVLDIDREDAKLLGMYAPTKVAPTDPTGKQEYSGLSDEERTKRLLALLRQAGVTIGEE